MFLRCVLLLAAVESMLAFVMDSSYYEVLGFSTGGPEASGGPSPQQLRRAYRRVALIEHPDKSDRPDAEARFRRVAEAFETLSDSNLRARYDQYMKHGGQEGFQRTQSFNFDPYEVFRNHVGDVWEHWEPGFLVEGDVVRNHEKVHVVIYPDGSSDISQVEESAMHRFRKVGIGWCVFSKERQGMWKELQSEVACREWCINLAPGCEGYAYSRSQEFCGVYRRFPSTHVADPSANGESDVICYQQNDTAFDVDSQILHRKITITDREQLVSYVITEMVCRDRPSPQRMKVGLKAEAHLQQASEQLPAGLPQGRAQQAGAQLPAGFRCRRPEPWSVASWPWAFKEVAGALSGGLYRPTFC